MSTKTIEQRYQKKTQLEHILLRPDTYIGSTEEETATLWIWSSVEERMVQQTITYVPGLYKIFDEILVNAADVKARQEQERKGVVKQKMTTIKVDIDTENNMISVWNDGDGIPVEIHKEHQVYVPEMIFGQLLTSDNYDDSETRVTGGRNGFGAKLTNIFSKKFIVECGDRSRGRKFRMVWRNNMTMKDDEPKITPYDGKDFVLIKFQPDLKQFKLDQISDDMLALLTKRSYDVAGTTGVKVILNGTRIAVSNFKDYCMLYFPKPAPSGASSLGLGNSSPGLLSAGSDPDDEYVGESPSEKSKNKSSSATQDDGIVRIHFKQERWEVVISQSTSGQFQQVSFTNSIATVKGGTHVTHVTDPLVAAILSNVQKKNKGGMEIKSAHVKNHLWVFVNCLIVNPTFDGQTKEYMSLKPGQFGSKCNLPDDVVKKVVKSPIVETILLWAQTKQQIDLQRKMKTTNKRGCDRLMGIPKLEDANYAGTKRAHECTLILTEGDSAKTSCLAGLSVVGRDKYGVFPLKGKLLNVRDASFTQLVGNKEIQNILAIMGLEVGKRRGDLKMRYGRVMIMTDQDHDGSHIKGLLINFMQHFWPDLLKTSNFLMEFVSPIVKVTKGSTVIPFFTIPEYVQWKNANEGGRGWKTKYYKGLGTSTDREFKEYFTSLDDHLLKFEYRGQEDDEAIDMAFNSKRAEDRKTWIQSWDGVSVVNHTDDYLSYKDFVDKELVQFSRYDTVRSIPSLVDGLKPGQRKVLFACIKKNLVKTEIKVAQLAGYVAEVSAYHHGEVSLQATIVNMAQRFVGSNNISLLEPIGQFGSRKEGGKDASAARYIFTRLSYLTKFMVHEADDPVLQAQYEEGCKIEPIFYTPIIPTVLVNGADGIGTGWSTFIPNYNPRDVIANIRRWLHDEPMQPMQPWYRNFKGTVEAQSKGTGFDFVGKWSLISEEDDQVTVAITELPVRFWTQDLKEDVEAMIDDGTWGETEDDGETSRASGKAKPKPKTVAKGKAKAGAKAKASAVSGKPVVKKRPPIFIITYRDNSTHDEVNVEVTMTRANYNKALALGGIEKVFKLRKSFSTSNMTLFDASGKIRRYDTELDIIRAFAEVRLHYYDLRKRYMVAFLEKEMTVASNRARFVKMVINSELIIHKKKKNVLVDELISLGFDAMNRINKIFIEKTQFHSKTVASMEEGTGDIEEESTTAASGEEDIAAINPSDMTTISGKDFDYLVGMPIWNLTEEKVEEILQQYESKLAELSDLKATTIQELWERNIAALEKALEQQEVMDEEERNENAKFRHQRRLSLKAGQTLKGRAKGKAKAKAAARASNDKKAKGMKMDISSESEFNGDSSSESYSRDENSAPSRKSKSPRPNKGTAKRSVASNPQETVSPKPLKSFSLKDRIQQHMNAGNNNKSAGVAAKPAFRTLDELFAEATVHSSEVSDADDVPIARAAATRPAASASTGQSSLMSFMGTKSTKQGNAIPVKKTTAKRFELSDNDSEEEIAAPSRRKIPVKRPVVDSSSKSSNPSPTPKKIKRATAAAPAAGRLSKKAISSNSEESSAESDASESIDSDSGSASESDEDFDNSD